MVISEGDIDVPRTVYVIGRSSNTYAVDNNVQEETHSDHTNAVLVYDKPNNNIIYAMKASRQRRRKYLFEEIRKNEKSF